MLQAASRVRTLHPILHLSGVAKTYRVGGQAVTVLRDINLTLHAGAMVAIVGPSGSGKSTLMNILGCLDRPSAGSYDIGGGDTRTLGSDALARLRRRHFGFIFQRYHLVPHLSALQNVELPAIYVGTPAAERKARASDLLTRLGLGDRLGYRPPQLSGGQQQRVAIARALMNGGKVILADEPTGALDSDTGRNTLRHLFDLWAQGYTVIIVTHDRGVAACAERIIELADGRIISDAPNPARRMDGGANSTVPRLEKTRHARPSGLRNLFEAFNSARVALLSHRLRTALTMLGIIIGIAAVVAIMAVGEGSRRHMEDTIGAYASNLLEIRRGSGWDDSRATGIHTLLAGDMEAIRQQPFVDKATPLIRGNFTARHRDASADALVSGVAESYLQVRNIHIASGRAFGPDDIRQQSQVAVIDAPAMHRLFLPTEDAVGQVIILGNVPFTVIGVTSDQRQDTFAGVGPNILLPYTTAGIRLFGRLDFDAILIRLAVDQDSRLAEQSIARLLTYKHGARDFFSSNMDALAKAYASTTRSISMMLSLVASIALVVGGVGVMNIMLVSVSERTREIGIRMAIGARRSDIMKQFLTEAVAICLIGGAFGILVALLSGSVFSAFVKEWRMVFTPGSIVLAAGCSTLVGVVFGFLPARKGSHLDPNDALAGA